MQCTERSGCDWGSRHQETHIFETGETSLPMNRVIKRTASPLTPALSPLRGEGEELPPDANLAGHATA